MTRRPGRRARSAAAATWALLGLLAALIGARADAAMRVMASIPPLADFARAVGGGLVEVDGLVPPGASPHTYELTPSQVAALARAQVLVLNGAGLEYWADKAVQAAGNPTLQVVDTSKGLPLLDEGHGGANPHVWLDPQLAIEQVRRIAAALVRADPPHAADYERNAADYTETLHGLDAEIAAQVRTWTQRRFVAFHPAWAYFARRYGLEEVGVVEPSPGREPSPADVARLVETMRHIKAKAIFAEPQFSPKLAQTIADESGAAVILLDPLGTDAAGGYVALMRHDVAQMAKALQ
jgi:ABC-type Zn uptake system ZnuABC Zn-binding protein ZnuA